MIDDGTWLSRRAGVESVVAAGFLRSWPGEPFRRGGSVGGDSGRGFRPSGVILCDTGPIVAAALVGDDHHRACVDLFTGLHLANRQLLVPATVVAEVGYLLNRDAGAEVEALFLTALADGDFAPVELVAVDYRRAAELVTTYADLPLGTTDATVIALSERLGVGEVATLDHRHFRVVRAQHVAALTLLP